VTAPPFVGLTGGIGAGKSEALAALSRLGAATISTDQVVHDLYEDPAVRDAVVDRWGPSVVVEGRVDRRAVAPGRRFTMQSNGGSSPFASSVDRAAATLLSGPAGGVTAGIELARLADIENVITFDMGGTSCDVALIQGGEPMMDSRGKIGGRDIALSMLGIHTVSAGGGTLALAPNTTYYLRVGALYPGSTVYSAAVASAQIPIAIPTNRFR
jgi:N-methylhydantoinase A/oxoprolinase/acetone carboxylase beta subunit